MFKVLTQSIPGIRYAVISDTFLHIVTRLTGGNPTEVGVGVRLTSVEEDSVP